MALLYMGCSLAVELGHTARWLWILALFASLLATGAVTGEVSVPSYYTAFAASGGASSSCCCIDIIAA